MYCEKCGKEIEESARFCPHCGTATAGGAAEKPEPVITETSAGTFPSYSGESYFKRVSVREKRGIRGSTALAIVCGVTVATIILVVVVGNSGLKGTYIARNYLQGATFGTEGIEYVTFKAFGQAEIGTKALFGSGTKYADSTYSISGDRITLTAKWGYTSTKEKEYTYSKSGDSIYIDGVEYVKMSGSNNMDDNATPFTTPNSASPAEASRTAGVPNVVGLKQEDAVNAIENVGLKTQITTQEIAPEGIEVMPYSGSTKTILALPGQVLFQNPTAGAQVQNGVTVTLTIAVASKTGAPGIGVVPNLVGQKLADAEAAIKAAGFPVGNIITQANDKAAGIVIAQDPAANSNLAKDQIVSITVSAGPAAAAGGTVSFTVNAGDTMSVIANNLVLAGLVNNSGDFLAEVNKQNAASLLKAGTFNIPKGSTPSKIVTILTK